jgi:hypothetical protein
VVARPSAVAGAFGVTRFASSVTAVAAAALLPLVRHQHRAAEAPRVRRPTASLPNSRAGFLHPRTERTAIHDISD